MEAQITSRKCTTCSEIKLFEFFEKTKRGKYGLRSVCKECRRLARFNIDYKKVYARHREKTILRAKIWKKENPDRVKNSIIKAEYGISLVEYENLKKLQNDVCAICKNKPKQNLAIDHCHTTGKIRGLLCNKCNSAIGFLKDDINLVSNALEYLSMGRKSSNRDKEWSEVQKLKSENKKLRQQIGKLRKVINNIDMDHYKFVQDLLVSQEYEEQNADILVKKQAAEEKWKCRECPDGTLRLIILNRLDGSHYFRKCDCCNHRTKTKKYNAGVEGV